MRGEIFDLLYAWIYRVNSAGQSTGQLDPDAVGAGPTVSPAYRLWGLDSLQAAAATRASVDWRSSGKPDGGVQAGLDTIGAATLTLTQWDNNLDPIINNGQKDSTTLSGMEFSSPNNMNPSPNTVGFCGIARLNLEGSVKGQKFIHLFYPRCTMSRNSPGTQQVSGNQTNPNNITVSIKPQIGDKFPVGVAFGANQNWYGFQEFEFVGVSDFPYFMDTWIADGSATTFNLTYKPKYSDVTGGNTKNWVTKLGVPTAPTSITPSTKAVVIPAAGTEADIWNVMYPVPPELLAVAA